MKGWAYACIKVVQLGAHIDVVEVARTSDKHGGEQNVRRKVVHECLKSRRGDRE